jgi:hypothetical protein
MTKKERPKNRWLDTIENYMRAIGLRVWDEEKWEE